MTDEALVLPLDVVDAAAVERAADEVVARWGRIDIWVNDATTSTSRYRGTGGRTGTSTRRRGVESRTLAGMNRGRIAAAALGLAALAIGYRAATT
jgi:NAD(P)-dependent dehydrogenase (short-subunit alcohol dehydrogenase family)